jgi:hypothetical protein
LLLLADLLLGRLQTGLDWGFKLIDPCLKLLHGSIFRMTLVEPVTDEDGAGQGNGHRNRPVNSGD